MFVSNLFEEKVEKILVIMPGRFQPWHSGHAAAYKYLCDKFGYDNVFICTSNKVEPPKSPFSFDEKLRMMALTGINPDRVVQSTQPYRAEELVKNYDPTSTALILAISEKDMAEDPRFRFGVKKNGEPTYYQPMAKRNRLVSLDKHGYVMTVPTFTFTVLGEPATSATEIRAKFAESDPETQKRMVVDLFGKFDLGVYNIIRTKLDNKVNEDRLVNDTLKEMKKAALSGGSMNLFYKKLGTFAKFDSEGNPDNKITEYLIDKITTLRQLSTETQQKLFEQRIMTNPNSQVFSHGAYVGLLKSITEKNVYISPDKNQHKIRILPKNQVEILEGIQMATGGLLLKPNEKILLQFETIELKNNNNLKKYLHQRAIWMNECNLRETSFTLTSYLNDNLLTESSNIVNFLTTIESMGIGKNTEIKIGDMLAVLLFDPTYHTEEISVIGFTDPKEIAKIMRTNEGQIKFVIFSDGEVFPKIPFAKYKNSPVGYPMFFNNKDSVEKALLFAQVSVPSGVNLHIDNKLLGSSDENLTISESLLNSLTDKMFTLATQRQLELVEDCVNGLQKISKYFNKKRCKQIQHDIRKATLMAKQKYHTNGSKNLSESANEAQPDTGSGHPGEDVRAKYLLIKARQTHPLARTDAEALALYIADQEARDVQKARFNDQKEEDMIKRLDNLETELEFKVAELDSRVKKIAQSQGQTVSLESYNPMPVVEQGDSNEEQLLSNPDPKIQALAKAVIRMKQQLAQITGQVKEAEDKNMMPHHMTDNPAKATPTPMTTTEDKVRVDAIINKMWAHARQGNFKMVSEYVKLVQPYVTKQRTILTEYILENVNKAIKCADRNRDDVFEIR